MYGQGKRVEKAPFDETQVAAVWPIDALRQYAADRSPALANERRATGGADPCTQRGAGRRCFRRSEGVRCVPWMRGGRLSAFDHGAGRG